jgi:hypothetical protein
MVAVPIVLFYVLNDTILPGAGKPARSRVR